MDEDLVKVDPSAPEFPDNPTENLSDDELVKQIGEASEKLAQQEKPEDSLNVEVQEEDTPATEPADKVEDKEVQTQEQVSDATEKESEDKPKEDVAVDQKPEAKDAMADLMEKKHLESPEELAPLYQNLEKEFHRKRQDEARQLRQPTQQPVPEQPIDPGVQAPLDYPPYQQVTPQQQFINEFMKDPFKTLVQAQQIVNQPMVEKQRQADLRNEVIKLSSSSKTADFNTPVMREEIFKVLEKRPHMMDNLSANIGDAYLIAKGNLSSQSVQQAVEQGKRAEKATIQSKKSAVVEHSSKPLPQPTFNPRTAPMDDLKKVILQEMKKTLPNI